MTSTREWTFGTHRAQLAEPDVLALTFEGPTTTADAEKMIQIYREVVAAHGPIFLVADISRSSLDNETRKYLGQHVQAEWFRGVVYVGASLVLRTISRALSVMVFFNAKVRYDVRFAANHDEAREQIAKWRETQRSAA